MKIAYISSSCIPSRTANSIHVMKMCQAFAINGHDVTLLAPDKKGEIEVGINDVYEYYGVKNCFKIIKLPWLIVKGRGYIYGFCAACLSKFLQPNIVYCRNIVGCYFSSLFGLPTLYESHMPMKYSGRIPEWMFKRIINYRKFIKLVVITNALKRYYRTKHPFFIPKIQVAPDGADPISETDRTVELSGGKRRFQVGYVGHLYKGKGMEMIIEIARHSPWANFHIVGGLEKDITYWKSKCNLQNNVIFHGHIPHKETVKYIQSFDAVLLPNQKFVAAYGGDYNNISQWTSPLKAFEYMAAGKAIISSDLPVLKEFLEDGRNAILCNPEDSNMWIDRLKLLASDPDYREFIGNNAQRDFLEKFSWENRAKRILDDLPPKKNLLSKDGC